MQIHLGNPAEAPAPSPDHRLSERQEHYGRTLDAAIEEAFRDSSTWLVGAVLTAVRQDAIAAAIAAEKEQDEAQQNKFLYPLR